MLLKSFGCSFIFGSELHDDGYGGPHATASQHTWPALLAKDMGYEYMCHARPGSGNLRILESIINHTAIDPVDVCVVGWTYIDRFDYANPSNDRWQTITPGDTDSQAENYYKNFHSQYRDKFTNLACIKLAIDTLKQKNIKFIMTYMDDLLFEEEWHATTAVLELQRRIRPYMTKFDGTDFLNWSRSNNFPIGTRGNHPLEDAHQAAFELIKSYNLL